MSIKSDKWIKKMSLEREMISPFEPQQVRKSDSQKIISYGTSSYGYDVREHHIHNLKYHKKLFFDYLIFGLVVVQMD